MFWGGGLTDGNFASGPSGGKRNIEIGGKGGRGSQKRNANCFVLAAPDLSSPDLRSFVRQQMLVKMVAPVPEAPPRVRGATTPSPHGLKGSTWRALSATPWFARFPPRLSPFLDHRPPGRPREDGKQRANHAAGKPTRRAASPPASQPDGQPASQPSSKRAGREVYCMTHILVTF